MIRSTSVTKISSPGRNELYDIRFLPPAARYLKKLKDKELRSLYQKAAEDIRTDPLIGREKSGDLKGIRSVDIYHHRINYELAYTIEENNIIVFISAGIRENFYNEPKRYWNP